MAAHRTVSTLLNAVTTTQTSGAADVSTGYGGTVAVKIVQVGTATTAASFVVMVSPDGGTTYYDIPGTGSFQAGTAAGTYDFLVDIPIGATKVEVSFTQQAGGTSSTCTAQASWVDTI